MRVSFMLAAAAISLSGAAFAEEAATGPSATATGPAAMTDAEMDGVTAAGVPPNNTGVGVRTAGEATEQIFQVTPRDLPSGVDPGKGTNTAGTTPGLSPSPLP